MKLIVNTIKLILLLLCATSSALAQDNFDIWAVLRNEFRLNHELNRPEVQEQIRWLAAHPGYVEKACRQSEPYIYHVAVQLKRKKLPGELALLPMIESAYDPFAYSGKGAAGLWQIMPKTAQDLGLKQDWWFDGRRSIGPSTDAALHYLEYLNKFFNGSWILAIAAYDSGEGTVSRAIKSSGNFRGSVNYWSLPVPNETKVYVPRFLAFAEIITNPARYHITLPAIPYLPYFEEVNIGSQIDLNSAAKLAGISYKELIKLNPGYNHWTTAPNQPFKLLIPKHKVAQFSFNLSNMPEEKRLSFSKLRVLKGDTVNNIAARYHTTANMIKKVNQLNGNYVKPNQSILIPGAQDPKATRLMPVPSTPLKNPQPILSAANKRVIHIVQIQETYETLQRLYNVSAKAIQAWNKLPPNIPLYQGQELVIWKKVRIPFNYVVQSGDTLSTIAKRNRTSVNIITALNPRLDTHAPLRTGQTILVG